MNWYQVGEREGVRRFLSTSERSIAIFPFTVHQPLNMRANNTYIPIFITEIPIFNGIAFHNTSKYLA